MTRSNSLLLGACLLSFTTGAFALGQAQYVVTAPAPGAFAIAQNKTTASIYVDPADWPGVIRAARDLDLDVERVTGIRPDVAASVKDLRGPAILIGTVGKSPLIDQLVKAGKIDVTPIKSKWESFFAQVVSQPLPGVPSALVIAGSDKRGAIYGVYDLSEQIGVSPWYFWADVPPTRHDALFAKPGKFLQGEPAVKYRGIFFNDEAPALAGWVKDNYGLTSVAGTANFGHRFYERVFELILRLKANYMWPAMWNQAFNEDDTLNPKLADEYGVVMGTSHHEPMIRAQQEWKRHGKRAPGIT
jgi:hypothetical protein